MKTSLKILALGAAVAASATMAKADTIEYNILVNGTSITGGPQTGTDLLNTGNITGSGYTVSITGVLPPAQNAPNFSTETLSVSDGPNAAAATVEIEVTDIGLTSGNALTLNTFSANNLDAPSFTGGSIANYYDSTNAAFGTGSELASAAFTGAGTGGFIGPIDGSLLGGTYSETTIYLLDFNANTTMTDESVSASSQIVAATPEPSSLALLGTTLLGAAGVARRRLLRK